jgi:hypothetical protein
VSFRSRLPTPFNLSIKVLTNVPIEIEAWLTEWLIVARDLDALNQSLQRDWLEKPLTVLVISKPRAARNYPRG